MSNPNKYKTKSFEEKKKEVDQLIESAEKKLEGYFVSEESIKECLKYMSKFYNYSLNNAMLIDNQFNGALAVGSYEFWKKQGYSVKKGEKGIKILVPIKSKPKFIRNNKDLVEVIKATEKEKESIKNGEIKIIQGTYFKLGNVFDISQTTAKVSDLPEIFPNKWIEGEVENYKFIYKGMEAVAKSIGVEILKPDYELGVVKGVSLPYSNEVMTNSRNSELQNMKTLLHELTHSKLHNKETRDNYTTSEKEFQAEMAAYTICSYFGLDTSDYSLQYLHSWTKGREFEDKQKLLKEVKEISVNYINIIEREVLKEVSQELQFYGDELAYGSAREGIKLYNEIKKNEREDLDKDNNKSSFCYENSINLDDSYKKYESILNVVSNRNTKEERGFEIEA
ncbi:ArdC-like ssDNA-binding domain-containing protein [Clostridium sp. LP20]|uniref:ArdC-like ssDNA-binding domain-containing protein n=1 Tax=Clostridium sp. LP20 TaxID=3418665 RepID=UPI003EE7F4FE